MHLIQGPWNFGSKLTVMKTKLIIISLLGLAIQFTVHAQSAQQNDYKNFVSSTLFVVANFAEDPPQYYQLNYGRRFTPKDVVSIEAITWTYKAPIGIPYGPDYEKPENNFPGKTRAYGAALAYQRFLWKGIYTQMHSAALHQDYLDENGKKIQSGFMLFNTLRFGYHLRFFKRRWFFEPSIAFTWWPVNTNLPESFQIEEDKWPNYFLFEPGLHFGFNF